MNEHEPFSYPPIGANPDATVKPAKETQVSIEHSYNFITGETTDYSALLEDSKLLPRRVFLNDEEQLFGNVVSCQTGDIGHVIIKNFMGQPGPTRREGCVRVEGWGLQMCKWEQPLHETPEIVIYFLINTLGDFLYMQNRLKRRGEMKPDVGVDDEKRAYLDQQLMVAMLRLRDGMQFADHAEYMKWFRWWSAWHRESLSDEQWRQLDRLLGTGKTEEDFKDWRPPGSWK